MWHITLGRDEPRMRTYTICLLTLGLITSSATATLCDEQPYTDKKDRIEALKAIAPTEYKTAQQTIPVSVDAALLLVAKAKSVWAQYRADTRKSVSDRNQATIAYATAWDLAIEAWKSSKDSTAQLRFIAQWNASLQEGPETPWLVGSLRANWDPRLVTPQFRELFLKTTDQMLLHAFCLVFGKYGRDAEEQLLIEKRDSLVRFLPEGSHEKDLSVANIDLALRKIDYWRKGDLDRSGPSEIPSPAAGN